MKGLYDSLGTSEKKVANYIISRPDDVIHYTITELAHFSGSSEATVYRLVKKLDFSGYQSFKIALARELSVPQESFYKEASEDFAGFVKGILYDNVKMAEQTLQVLDLNELKMAIKMISSARRVLFFGVGRSAAVAQSASLNFALLGFATECYIDPHTQVMVASGLGEEDLVVGISHTGTIRDTIKSLQVAKEAGASTIVITSGINSPIVETADVVLYTAAGEPSRSEFTLSRISELLVLDILYKCVVSELGSSMKKHFNRLEQILRPKRF
ncbi:MurR/RpiR family transcriptional regulator [Kosmotoga pacifica]|uniref:MurR/RpiR family transcriptional regulator n=1 Tax=Kosmotoga pacifica TaxID=1330330 RepID=UPI002587CEFB|nr:MurR/RpiR family transcriptional regulator [Kosmotoga pacifica]